jgi:hypothetical protein
MQSAAGSSSPGRWWSVISVAMPSSRARATPSTLAMPLSTVTIRPAAARRQVDDVGRQAVAVGEAVRYQIIDARAEGAQRPDADRAGGRAVAVVVGDDEDSLPVGDGVGEQTAACGGVRQARRRQQRREFVVEFAAHATMPRAGVDARQQRVQALLFELPLDALRDGAAAQGVIACLWPAPARWPPAAAGDATVATARRGRFPRPASRKPSSLPGAGADPAAGERFLQRREPAGFEVEQGGAVGVGVFVLHRRCSASSSSWRLPAVPREQRRERFRARPAPVWP